MSADSFPLRRDVDDCNHSRLQALPEPMQTYFAMDGAGNDVRGIPIPTGNAQTLLDRLIAPPVVSLKVREPYSEHGLNTQCFLY